MRFILASSSPRRREMIASLGIDFEIIKPDVDETRREGEDPYAYVQRMSKEKAAAVIQQITQNSRPQDTFILAADTIVLAADTIVLAADTIGVEVNGELLGKPEDANDAKAMLKRLRGQPHTVCTAFELIRIHGLTQNQVSGMECTRVTMREYSDAEIDAYVATGDPLDKAGSYAIQHPQFQPVAKIEGCYNTVVGLPLCRVKVGLHALGWPDVPPQPACDCPTYTHGQAG